MRIAIDLSSDNFSGLERYALELSRALIRESGKHGDPAEFILVVKNFLPEMLKPLAKDKRVRFVRIRGKNKLIANQLTLPLTMARIPADIYLFPAFPVPLLFHGKRSYANIADRGCYDCPGGMTLKQRLFFRAGAKHSVRVCEKLVTISAFSSGRIEHILGVKKERQLLLYCGIRMPEKKTVSAERIAEVRERYRLPEKYWLSLCTLEPRKNLKLLIAARRELTEEGVSLPTLVLAGRKGWLTEELFEGKDKCRDLLFPGFIGEADLPALYAGAECFIFPSLYEGFGLPPLEAQACGVRRVLASDAAALKEVLGDTAYFFKNDDKASLKEAMKAMKEWDAPAPRDILRNLERFRWEKAAGLLWKELTAYGQGDGK